MRLKYSDVTDEKLYLSRRAFMVGAAALAAAGRNSAEVAGAAAPPAGAPLPAARNAQFSGTDTPTKLAEATSYNNFYEFGVNKDDPARLAASLKPRPWTVEIGGLVAKSRTLDIDDVLKVAPLEER